MFGSPGDVILCLDPPCDEMIAQLPNCNIPGEDPENAIITDSFYRIDFDEPGDDTWQTMMDIFTPYFKDRGENGIMATNFDDGCGKWITNTDAIISSTPWIVNYRKVVHGAVDELYLSSTSAQAIRERNLFSRDTIDTMGTSSCELRSTTPHPAFWAFGGFDDDEWYYDIAYAKNIYLIRYQPGSERIGRCAVDDNTYLPVVNTYGWCEPCTTSTLAYQEISATDRVYMPAYTANVEDDEYDDLETLCELKYDYDWEGIGEISYTDNVSCFNQHVPDISDYKESIGSVGSPRTIPEATIMKERLGNYMKSGILPVLDMSNETNWDIENPDGGQGFTVFWFSFDFGSEDEFLEYDFEGLLGEMGAAVIIVETIDEVPDTEKVNEIVERAATVRENCFGCLAAVQVNDAEDTEELSDMLSELLSHPSGQMNIDLVTFSYEVSDHDDIETAEGIVQNMEDYGRTILTTPDEGRGKPSMIVGFNVRDDDNRWDDEHLFNTIVTSQDELIKAGITGIIYSPVRGSGQKTLVDVDGGVGTKKDKFCAMQGAMERMSQSPPTAIFTRVNAQNVTCQKCTGIEITLGQCSMTCDDGNECDMPEDASESFYKCPDNSVTEDCPLCTDLSGEYNCILRYVNGSEVPITGNLDDLDSDIWMDVIGGLSKPDRCCLEKQLNETESLKYSYYSTSLEGAINKPIVFPKSGDPNLDCGMGDMSDLSQLSSFCNINNIPIKEYDIECEVS